MKIILSCSPDLKNCIKNRRVTLRRLCPYFIQSLVLADKKNCVCTAELWLRSNPDKCQEAISEAKIDSTNLGNLEPVKNGTSYCHEKSGGFFFLLLAHASSGHWRNCSVFVSSVDRKDWTVF